MKQHVKYARARDQLYHYVVSVRKMHESIPTAHRTDELISVMGIVEEVVQQAASAFERGDLMAVNIDCYTPVVLPGFEELMAEMKRAVKDDEL